jgi:hypothetical protein
MSAFYKISECLVHGEVESFYIMGERQVCSECWDEFLTEIFGGQRPHKTELGPPINLEEVKERRFQKKEEI